MINLLPNNIREEQDYGRKNIRLVALIAVIAGTAVLVALIMIVSLGFVSKEEEAVQKSIEDNKTFVAELELETKDLSSVAGRLNSTYALFEENIEFSKLIPEIGSLLPEGSVINTLSLTGGSTDPLSLSVSTTSAELVPVLQKNLVNSELFEAADVISISPGGDGERYLNTVSLSVSFTGSAEAKRKEAAAAAAAAQAQAEAQASEAGQ